MFLLCFLDTRRGQKLRFLTTYFKSAEVIFFFRQNAEIGDMNWVLKERGLYGVTEFHAVAEIGYGPMKILRTAGSRCKSNRYSV